MLFRTAGGSAIYATGPLDRAFRDIHSAAQHPLVSLRGYEIAGRALLGAYYWNTFSSLGGGEFGVSRNHREGRSYGFLLRCSTSHLSMP